MRKKIFTNAADEVIRRGKQLIGYRLTARNGKNRKWKEIELIMVSRYKSVHNMLPCKASVFIIAAALSCIVASSAQAGLAAVSGGPDPAVNEVLPNGNPALVSVSLANGFPIWYRDANGRKLALCLDPPVQIAPGVTVDPCELEQPFPGAPVSFPNNFGSEAMYWSAVSSGTFSSSNGTTGSVLLVCSQQAGFVNEASAGDGLQTVFSRIRLRIDAPVAGTYRVTYPFGARDYVVTAPGIRAINQTQDLGILTARDFLVSMINGPVPAGPVPPSINVGAVNADGATIGPFLVPSQTHGGVFNPVNPVTFAGGPVTLGGSTYIGLPFAPNAANPALPLDVFQPVESVNGVNYFEIRLLDPPAGFLLDASGVDGTADNVLRFSNFQLIGKLFDDSANLAPTAAADSAGVSPGVSAVIDVVANDTDPVGPGNAHGINPQAIALVHPGGSLVLVSGLNGEQGIPTTAGGRARRTTNTLTGKTRILYTPPVGFVGTDTFQYVVQDHGGRVSAPATVTVRVEDIQTLQAEYRPRLGKWHISGTTSQSSDNSIKLTTGPLASLRGSAAVPPVVTAARGEAGLRIGAESIEFALRVDPLPAGAVRTVYIRVGNPGENGPAIFNLFNDIVHGDFTSRRSGVLSANDLQVRPERGINTFPDACAAILQGEAYISVHTVDHPESEIRGRLLRPVIGIATVRPEDGVWRFHGKTTAGPGMLPGVNAESANGVRAPGVPLRLR